MPTKANIELINATGQAGIVLVCEHASRFIPEKFSDLGLQAGLLTSHIAWDPGALPVARALSAILDAPLVATTISRLVYDCNRPVNADSAVPEQSEIYRIPGNAGLDASDRQARSELYYRPYRRALVNTIDGFMKTGRRPVIVSIHTFTPVYKGEKRDFDIGILHDSDTRLADQLLEIIAREGGLESRRNAPYGPGDGVTYTLVEHALPRGLLNVMFEIRNDLVSDSQSRQTMAERLAGYLRESIRKNP